MRNFRHFLAFAFLHSMSIFYLLLNCSIPLSPNPQDARLIRFPYLIIASLIPVSHSLLSILPYLSHMSKWYIHRIRFLSVILLGVSLSLFGIAAKKPRSLHLRNRLSPIASGDYCADFSISPNFRNFFLYIVSPHPFSFRLFGEIT